MRIKELYATFGKLENKTLRLSPGMNVIYGENESGKSTWSAFVRAMLFGVSTREKARVGHLPDKEKYLPWSGSAMYGRLLADTESGELEIERTSSKTGVFSKERAFFTETGEAAPTGEELCGVSRTVFERTAYIAQSHLGIDGDADTEKRILSMASSGDETVSAAEVEERLNSRRYALRSKRGLGVLPGLESEKQKKLELLTKICETEEEIEKTGLFLSEKQEERKKLLRQIAIAESEARASREEYIKRAKEELKEVEETLRKVADFPQSSVLTRLSDIKNEWQERSLASSVAKGEFSFILREQERINDEASRSPFAGLSYDVAAKKACNDKKSIRQTAKRTIPAIALLAAGAALLFVFPYVSPALMVGSVLWFVLSGRVKKKKLMSGYGSADIRAIDEALEKYKELLSEKEELSKRISDKKLALEKNTAACDMRYRDIISLFSGYGITTEDVSDGENILREKVRQREEAERNYERAKVRVEALGATEEREAEKIEYAPDEIPRESADELKIHEAVLLAEQKEAELTLSALRERISGLDRENTEKKLFEISEKISENEKIYDAISTAVEVIAEADRELKGRFAPEIEKRAAEIFSEITGGSFEVVRIRDREFDMEVAKGVATAPKNKLMLSAGTLDELYLSLRLALCEMILPENFSPIILDDAFVNFDGTRLERTLRFLKKLSEKRQIIIFTCHTREAELFREDEKVNKIKL
ncbi:MAG: AAA family ATPase [Oscillospiraceae bacterium]|nr:AAA family ATPase [Oscillospiraceae bacterium]